MYSWCNTSVSSFLVPSSSICFDDGEGLWAPHACYVLQPNRTYYLRIKTATACDITVSGQYVSPANNNCIGALALGMEAIAQNNACHKPSADVQPSQLCAMNLENTAFYKFYVASNGSAVININNIACDNGNTNNSSGFQVGFFTGNCGSLVPLNCETGSGSFVQASTTPLPAGSLVFVAVDGVSGSNCRYTISGINIYGVLSTNFKNFSGWKKPSSNLLKWTTLNDSAAYYIIERSSNGAEFLPLGQVIKPLDKFSSVDYLFEDLQPVRLSYYRVKQVHSNGQLMASQVIKVLRQETGLADIKLLNTQDQFRMEIFSEAEETAMISLVNGSGQVVYSFQMKIAAGNHVVHRNHSNLPAGKYFIILETSKQRMSKGFLRQ